MDVSMMELAEATTTTQSTPLDVVSMPLVRQQLPSSPQPSEMSPLLAAVIACGCVVAAVVIAVATTYGLYKLTWKKKKAALQENEVAPVGILPSRRTSSSASFMRQVSVLTAEQQLYEGLTPEKREMLEVLRSQNRRVGSAGFATRRTMSLAPLSAAIPKNWGGEPTEQWDLLCPPEDDEHIISDIRRHSCLPPEDGVSHHLIVNELEQRLNGGNSSYGSATTTITTVSNRP